LINYLPTGTDYLKFFIMPRGRPREFDPDEVLDRAVHAFWRRGFRATSLNELARELGIEKPSLYAAFGNKEQLFLKALDRYAAGFGRRAIAALDTAPTGREAIAALLSTFAEQLSDPKTPAGCLIANCAAECGDSSETISRSLANSLGAMEVALAKRLKRAQKERELPASEDARSLARYFAAVIQGMVSLSRAKRDPKALQQIVRIALRAWPAKSRATLRNEVSCR
jgi:AcrR family transcriptional regulator